MLLPNLHKTMLGNMSKGVFDKFLLVVVDEFRKLIFDIS
jgi:hypothetical protein